MRKHHRVFSLLVCLVLLSGLVPYHFPTAEASSPSQAGLHDVDIVFVMDTSGSMDDEFSALCSHIDDVVADLLTQGIRVRHTILGIYEMRQCAQSTVPQAVSAATVDHEEDWGPAVRDLAVRYQWQPGAIRLIVPMSDEAPENGNSCDVPGPDEDAINAAVTAAVANRVRVAPILGSGYDSCIEGLARRLAEGTGGYLSYSHTPATDLAAKIRDLIGTVAEDRDGDGIADQDDPDPDDACVPDPQVVCLPRQVCVYNNTPHWDDDKDGRTDEEVANSVDDDGDHLIDEDVGGVDCPYPEQDCGIQSHRGFDDDNDGWIDEEIDDGQDNDGDHYVDEDVECSCPVVQQVGVNDTPGVDDDHDFRTDEERADGKDDDGDGCVDEDVSAATGPDFTIVYVEIEPIKPNEMESCKLIYEITNAGDAYTPKTGKFHVDVLVKDQNSPQYWEYGYDYQLSGDPQKRGATFSLSPFLFLYAGTYQVEIQLEVLDANEQNTANNRQVSRLITVESNPTHYYACLRLILDVIAVAVDLFLVPGGGELVEKANYLLDLYQWLVNTAAAIDACTGGAGIGGEACWHELWDIALDVLIEKAGDEFIKRGLAKSVSDFLTKHGAKFLGVLFLSIGHVVLSVKHALQCGWNLGDLLIRAVHNIRNRGVQVNAVLIESPLNAVVTNSRGARTGILPDGTVVREIEDSEVVVEGGRKFIAYPGADTASITFSGAGEGAFTLTTALSQPGSDEISTAVYRGVPVSASTVGQVNLEQQLSLEIDDNNDGQVDRQVGPTASSGPLARPPAAGGGVVAMVVLLAVLAVVVGGGVILYVRRKGQAVVLPAAGQGPAAAAAALYLAQGQAALSQLPLSKQVTMIGRDPGNDLVLHDPLASRAHARITSYPQGYLLEDLGSANGTLVNGVRVQQHYLRLGDHIQLGDVVLTFWHGQRTGEGVGRKGQGQGG